MGNIWNYLSVGYGVIEEERGNKTNSDEYKGETWMGYGLLHRECVGHIGSKTEFHQFSASLN